jgi:ABC-type branched-subunit amino acid transport system ATPase component
MDCWRVFVVEHRLFDYRCMSWQAKVGLWEPLEQREASRSAHISDLHVHRFRGLRDASFTSLGSISLIVGDNNSGKTSVLEAITVFCRPLDAAAWVETARRREARQIRASVMQALKWLFPQTSTDEGPYTGELRITGHGQFPVRSVVGTYSEHVGVFVDGEPDRDDPSDDIDSASALLPESSEVAEIRVQASFQREPMPLLFFEDPLVTDEMVFTMEGGRALLLLDRARGPLLPFAVITPYAHQTEHRQVTGLSRATEHGLKDQVVAALQLMDEDIIDLHIVDRTASKSTVMIEHKRVGMAPVAAFGDGLRRVLAIALSVPFAARGVLLLDEMEAALHVSALQETYRWLVRVCRQFDIQLIATTHSLEAADALLDVANEGDGLSLFRLNQVKDLTEVRRVDLPMLSRLRHERGYDVR